MTKSWIYLNNVLLKENEVPEIALDRGLFFGDGVFESMRSIHEKILGLEYHIERLFQGIKVLQIEPAWAPKEIQDIVSNVVKQSGFEDCYLRINVTRGKWLGSVPPVVSTSPTLMMIVRKFLPFREELYQKGFKTLTLSTRRNETSPLCQIKSLNYLNNILGRMQALEKDFDEGIFLNTKGFLTEGTASNLFLIEGDRLLTPPLEDGVLPGVTRKIILQEAPVLGLKPKIRSLVPEDIFKSDEAFLTNSSMGVIPWVQSDAQIIGKGSSGTWTQKMRSRYELLQKEVSPL